MILDKKQMTEEDIKLNYITPALNAAGWENGVNITMETKITDGRISLKGNVAYRESAKKADYILYLNKYHPSRSSRRRITSTASRMVCSRRRNTRR